MRPQPTSPLFLLGLLLVVCLIRPAAGDGMALAPMQSAGWSETASERGGWTSIGHRRSTTCPYGQRYSSFYGKCVRWWIVKS